MAAHSKVVDVDMVVHGPLTVCTGLHNTIGHSTCRMAVMYTRGQCL